MPIISKSLNPDKKLRCTCKSKLYELFENDSNFQIRCYACNKLILRIDKDRQIPKTDNSSEPTHNSVVESNPAA